MATTLDDVAKRAGCSTATVSRVVNGTDAVSDAVRSAVEAAIAELGYVPRRSRSTAAGRAATATRLFAVLLHRRHGLEEVSVSDGSVAVSAHVKPDAVHLLTDQWQLSNDFYRPILDGIVLELARHEAKATLQVVTDLADPELVAELASEVQGVLVVGEGGAEVVDFLATCHLPAVLVDILVPGSTYEQVTTDNLGGLGQVLAHFADLGHRRVGYISGGESPVTTERAEAFAYHAYRLGLEVVPGWGAVPYDHIEGTTARVTELLAAGDRPTAIACCNDWGAVSVQRAAAAAGIAVPQQLSVAGFDDVVVAQLVTPPLTSVRVDGGAIGRLGARLLATQDRAAETGSVTRVPAKLVVRGSTAPPG